MVKFDENEGLVFFSIFELCNVCDTVTGTIYSRILPDHI